MKRVLSSAIILTATFLITHPTWAETQNRINVGIGSYDLHHDNSTPALKLEFLGLKTKILYGSLSPYAGLKITREGSVWIGAGIVKDFKVAKNIFLTPSLAIGYYNKGNSKLNLGHAIEFKSEIMASYQFENKHRIGLSLAHISNAGLDNTNPGAEIISLNYSVPFRF